MIRVEVNCMSGEVVEHEMSAEEIAVLPLLPVEPAAIPPISPRQIRMALTKLGLRVAVENAVAEGDQDLKDWWEYSNTIERDNPQVLAMGIALGQTSEQLDALWQLGATL